MLTSQQILDTAIAAIVTQGKLSFNAEERSCKYRDPTGNKCIVGVFIPDALYDERFDNGANSSYYKLSMLDPEQVAQYSGSLKVNQLFVNALNAGGIDTADGTVHNLMSSLQQCHDESALRFDMSPAERITELFRRLEDFAACAGLEFNVPESTPC
jgi:hypothetical protein